ncbi:MAG: tetratricopeptide repeat protein [Bacteroidota bacterium]
MHFRQASKLTFHPLSAHRTKALSPYLIVFCTPLLLYLQTLWFGFTSFDDDKLITNNLPFLSHLRNTIPAFLTDAYLDGSSHFYRPLQTVSYIIDTHLSAPNHPWIFHFSSILLFSCIACLLFALLKRFSIPAKPALWATLVYVAHPLFVSNVAYLPTRGDLLLMLFSLASFLLFINFLKNRKPLYLAAHLLFFILALFSKETAAFLPLLFLLYYLTFASKKQFQKKQLLIALCYAVSLAGWYWLRTIALGNKAGQNELYGIFSPNHSVGIMPLLQNLRTLPEALSSFFLPYNIAPIPGFTLFKTALGLVISIAIIVLIIKSKAHPTKEKLFCIAWFIILLLPNMLYKHPLLDYLNHRFLLPLTGILLLLLFLIPTSWFQMRSSKSNVWVALLFLCLSAITFINSKAYKDAITFYDAAIAQNPKSALAYNNRGFIYNSKEYYKKAIADYTQAIALQPHFTDAHYNRGIAYQHQGLLTQAIADFTQAIQQKPNYTDAYNNRGNAYSKQGMFQQAIADYTTAINLKPDYAELYSNRGVLYARVGLYNQAVLDFTKAVEINPNCAEAYNNRGITFRRAGFPDKSCADFQKAAALGSRAAQQNLDNFCNK